MGIPDRVSATSKAAPPTKIGKAVFQNLEQHAVLWKNNKLIDLNSLLPPNSGWLLTQANGINNRGQFVGGGIYRGKPHAFLLTPR